MPRPIMAASATLVVPSISCTRKRATSTAVAESGTPMESRSRFTASSSDSVGASTTLGVDRNQGQHRFEIRGFVPR